MKTLYTVCVTFLALVLYSCQKSNVTLATPPSVVGHWNLVADSTSSFLGASQAPTLTTHKYIGTAADYYNFNTDGKVYINNKGRLGLDTAYYKVVSPTKLNIYYLFSTGEVPYAGGNGTFNVTTLTAHSLIINTTGLTPEGPITTFLTLSR
jgi:hypothetical protein